MTRTLAALLFTGMAGACATAPAPGPQPYLATYRPLEARPGEIIAYPTAALDGRLEVRDGCFVVVSGAGAATLVAFAPQVSVVQANGRWGLRDARENRRVLQGEAIGVGGASIPDPDAFIATRLQGPPPPPGCPRTMFLSNAGFGRR